jgi:hypothetical protein
MSTEGPRNGYAFIINTDKYAGNFEREMCAYLTGTTGDCEVGQSRVDQEITDKFEMDIQQVADDHGCYRPTSLWTGSTGHCNAVAIFFENKPTEEQISIMKERAMEFGETDDLVISGFSLSKFTTKETVEEEISI